MGKTKVEAPPAPLPPPSPGQVASETAEAQIKYDPQAAESRFNILSNPQYGLLPTTQQYADVRQQVFPQQSAVESQLAQNILASLLAPRGITPEQQGSINTRRGEAQTNLQTALRERANLGGGLYGGRAIEEETKAVSDLQRAFSEEDINREQIAYQNAIQAAIPFLQILYPDVGITAPQFSSPVSSPDAYMSSLTQARGQDVNAQIAAAQNRANMQSALYSGLGQAAGGIGGGLMMACHVASEVFGGWNQPETFFARIYVIFKSPKWFRNFYIKFGKRIATFIHDKPILKNMIRPLFESFAKRGRQWLTQ